MSVGANALTDNYDDADPGEIQAPTSHIGQIIASGLARFDAEAGTLVGAVRLTGDAISGNPVITLYAFGVGASGTGAGQTTLLGPTVLNVDIPVKQGANMRVIGLVAGTAGDEIAMSVTVVFN